MITNLLHHGFAWFDSSICLRLTQALLHFHWQGALIAVLFAMIYKFLPDVVISWKNVWIGAAVTALLFSAGKYLIGLYLGQTATTNAFGAAGSLVVLLFWVYYSALISFLGAEFTQVYARRYGPGIQPKEHAVRVGHKSDSI